MRGVRGGRDGEVVYGGGVEASSAARSEVASRDGGEADVGVGVGVEVDVVVVVVEGGPG